MHQMIRESDTPRQVSKKILEKIRHAQICPWCLEPHAETGVCADCQARIELANLTRMSGVLVVALPDLAKAPLDLQLMALLQDEGAIACWTRPNRNGYASMLGVSYQTVMRSLRRMVKLGWLEKRGSTFAEFRVAILPQEM